MIDESVSPSFRSSSPARSASRPLPKFFSGILLGAPVLAPSNAKAGTSPIIMVPMTINVIRERSASAQCKLGACGLRWSRFGMVTTHLVVEAIGRHSSENTLL